MTTHAPALFTPLRIRDTEVKNRIWVSPMCQYSAVDGVPNDWHLVHLVSRAVGGAGLVVAEATGVNSEARISPGDTGIWNDDQTRAWRPIVDAIHKQGSKAGLQIAHAGRKASTSIPWQGGGLVPKDRGGWQPVAPSPLAFDSTYATPTEMSGDAIRKTIHDFSEAARRALKAGFDVIELHMAHGYLVHEFLSPLSNHRSDEYGGSFENRIRFAVEIAQAVRAAWPAERALFARLSCTDWMDGDSWDLNQSIELARRLKSAGVDLIDCSSGGLVPQAKIPVGPGYQVRFAAEIKKQAQILTGAVGMITEPEQAEAILRENQADAIFLARAFLRDPYWALHAAQSLGHKAKGPVQYGRAF